MRHLLLALLLSASPLTAQTASPLARAAGTITSADVAHRIGIIADDSMLGRDTPSRGLEMTAQYVASQFKRFGLKPGGDSGGWFQRYPITRRRLDLATSRIVFKAGATSDTATLARSARLVSGPSSPALSGPVVLVGGDIRQIPLGKLVLQDKVVLYPLDFTSSMPETATQVIRVMRLAGSRAVILLSNLDSASFAARLPGTHLTGRRQRWSGGSRR